MGCQPVAETMRWQWPSVLQAGCLCIRGRRENVGCSQQRKLEFANTNNAKKGFFDAHQNDFEKGRLTEF